ncbi:MAG: LysM peptidoglycan-binding domain-containing protein [Oscillospiraceae bacterium]|nr:LysM peptidoglycan-binding domain-containing protein [Oscillospiraceae bacterium]
MYRVYMSSVLLPIVPSEINLKVKNANKTITLINEGEINFLRSPGLTELEFEILLPAVQYSFAQYDGGFRSPSYYTSHFESLKTSKAPFQFIVVRSLPNGTHLFNTNMTVSLEDYTVKEKSKEGFDLKVAIKLKQYRHFSTKTVHVINEKTSVKKQRQASSSPAPSQGTTYTVKDGDCLWNIAKAIYGDGAQYAKIYAANQDKVVNPNLIYTGQVLTIPPA